MARVKPHVGVRAVAHGSAEAAFAVTLQRVVAGQQLAIDIWDIDPREDNSARRKLGSLSGTVHVSSRQEGFAPVYALSDLHFEKAQPSSDDSIAVMVMAEYEQSAPGVLGPVVPRALRVETVNFPLPPWAPSNLHGRHWQVSFEVEGEVVCAPFAVQVASHQLEVGKDCTYERHDGNAVTFYNDASEDAEGTRGYFADLLKAIDRAQEFILIADWSFHPLFRLNRKVAGLDATVGAILLKKARENKSLTIAIHTWDHTNIGSPDAQNDQGDAVLSALANGPMPENLVWTSSSRSIAKWSHHQKMVVVDTDGASGRRDVMAFVGGIDLSRGRFDWPAHRVRADVDGPGAAEFTRMREHLSVKIPKPDHHPVGIDEGLTQTIAADDWYNAELDAVAWSSSGMTPRQPWHDVHSCIKGPTAFDLVTEFIGRWLKTAGTYRGRQFAPKLRDLYHRNFALSTHQKDIINGNRFVRQYDSRDLSDKTPWSAQVYRSMDRSQWEAPDQRPSRDGKRDGWSLVRNVERSIQRAYVENIGLAERFIYIETQYLIDSGKNRNDEDGKDKDGKDASVPQKLVERILHHFKRKARFHVYVVTPMFPEGDLYSAPVVQQRWNQWRTIESMVTRLHATMKDRWQDYLSFYFPFQAGEATYKANGANRAEQLRAAQRYQIYVHSKMMIVDDEYAIIGSANLNERSLAGDRDTEICVGMWPANARMRRACTEALQEFRGRLWSEHLSKLPPSWKSPEHIDCVRDVRSTSLRRFLALKNELPAPEPGHLMALPLKVVSKPGLPLQLRVEPLMSTEPEPRKAPPGQGDDATPMMFVPDHVGIDCGTWWSEPSYLDNSYLRDVTE